MWPRQGAANCMGSAMSIPTWLAFYNHDFPLFFMSIGDNLWMAEDKIMADSAPEEEDSAMGDAMLVE